MLRRKIFIFSFFLLPFVQLKASDVQLSHFIPLRFTSNYEEKIISASGKEKISRGHLSYQYPGHLKLEVRTPHKSLFVVNPQKTWLYQPAFIEGESDQVTIQKTTDLPLLKLFDSLREGIKKTSKVRPTREGKNLHFDFTSEGKKEFGLEKVILHGPSSTKEVLTSLKQVSSMTLIYSNKKNVDIKLSQFKEGVKFPADEFHFKPSPKTKVIFQ